MNGLYLNMKGGGKSYETRYNANTERSGFQTDTKTLIIRGGLVPP